MKKSGEPDGGDGRGRRHDNGDNRDDRHGHGTRTTEGHGAGEEGETRTEAGVGCLTSEEESRAAMLG